MTLIAMNQEERQQRLANYWVYYYDELSSQLPNYTADPESVPHFLRDHGRRLLTLECQDGYIVLHIADHENMHNASTQIRFELDTSRQPRTVGDVMDMDLPSDAPFWTTLAPYLKEQATGKYVEPSDWERRDLIANRRIEQWSAERWRAQSGEEAIAQAG